MFKVEVLGLSETSETTRLTTASHSDDLNRHQHCCGSGSNAGLQLVTSPRCADRTSACSCWRSAARYGIVTTLRLNLADDTLVLRLIGTKSLTYRRLWRYSLRSVSTLHTDVWRAKHTFVTFSQECVRCHQQARQENHTHTHTRTHHQVFAVFPLSLVRIVLAVFVEYHGGFGALLFISQPHSDCSFWSLSE